MTLDRGTDPNDLTIEQARAQFAADIRRLNAFHKIEGWSINTKSGALIAMCSCSHRAYEIADFAHHWVDAVKKERGPLKKR